MSDPQPPSIDLVRRQTLWRSNSATMTAPGWRPWTILEEKRLFAAKARGALKDELMAEFPGRTWEAIKRRRCSVGSVGVPLTALRKRELEVYTKACPLFRALTARRRALGITRDELAATLGVYSTTLGHWEYGTAEPNWGKVVRWAEALGMSVVAREKT